MVGDFLSLKFTVYSSLSSYFQGVEKPLWPKGRITYLLTYFWFGEIRGGLQKGSSVECTPKKAISQFQVERLQGPVL